MASFGLRLFFICAFSLLNLLGCGKPVLVTSDDLNSLASTTLYYTSNSIPRVYFVSSDSNPGKFVTELDPKTALSLPRAVFDSEAYGKRNNSAQPQDINLILRVYNPSGSLGTSEQYFETLLLYQNFRVSNVTTALSWIMRWSFGSFGSIRVSDNFFNSLVNSAEIICKDCRKKTSSQVVQIILQSDILKSQILDGLNRENAGLNISAINYQPPDYIYVYSTPNAVDGGVTLKDSKESEKVNFAAKVISPLESQTVKSPIKWVRTFKASSIDYSPNEGSLEYTFGYDEFGDHEFQPVFDLAGKTLGIKFKVSVSDTNRIPLCDEPLTISVRENYRISYDLKTKCRDLDIDESNLSFSLVGGPAGLTISTLGQLEWTGKKVGSVDQFNVDFVIGDSKLGSQAVRAVMIVTQDMKPQFVGLPSYMSMVEGAVSTASFTAVDPDGDPIIVKVVPISTIQAGAPAGSGILTDISRSPLASGYQFDWTFTPSWMQGVGLNSTADIQFQIFYDPVDDRLDATALLASQTVTLSITNTDDPPLWIDQPQPFAATEAVPIVNLVIGKAIDAPLNPTTLTYSLRNLSSSTCQWLEQAGAVTADGSGNILLNITPAYNSLDECKFVIVVSDANTLSSESSEGTITVTDTNRPVSVLPVAPTNLTIKEGVLWSETLEYFFYDADIDEIGDDDPREFFAFTCMLDTDLDGIYEKNCLAQAGGLAPGDFRMNYQSQSFGLSITPSPGWGGQSYHVELTATDKGGVQAVHHVIFDVLESPSAMITEMTQDLVNSTSIVTVEENTSSIVYLKVSTASARPIDYYDYKIVPTGCVKIGGGACRVGFLTTPASMTGTGDDVFPFTISPNYSEGDIPLPDDRNQFVASFRVEKLDDPLLGSDISLVISVKNSNRLPTALSILSKLNESCSGTATPDAGTTDHTFCVDASKDVKSGSNWTKTYTANLGAVDADLTNDLFTHELLSPKAPGSVSAAKWSFKLPSCVSVGSSTVNRNFSFRVSDGRGGFVDRTIILKLMKANLSASCMQ